MPTIPFKKGHDPRRANGGFRQGSGRKPDWFKAKMRELATSKKAIKFLADCIDGAPVEILATEQGLVPAPARAETRIKAWESTADRGYGRPTQAVEMVGEVTVNLIEAIKQAREKRGLPLKP